MSKLLLADIVGIEGIFEACKIFKHMHPGQGIFPVASTLGAAKAILNEGEGPQEEVLCHELRTTKRYRSLFRKLLAEVP